jgi:hypothetical protein
MDKTISSTDLIHVPVYTSASPTNTPTTPSPALPTAAASGVLNKLLQLTEKLKSSLSMPSPAEIRLPSEEFLDSLPSASLRETVTSSDDGTEILIGEISTEKWGEVIESYPVYVMEVEGSDPVFEQYLKERNFELRRRRLSLQQRAKEGNGGRGGGGEGKEGTDLRSSFIASSQPQVISPPSSLRRSQEVEGKGEAGIDEEVEGMVERLSTELQHFSLVIGSEVMTDEEIILHEEIQQIQDQVLPFPCPTLSPHLVLLPCFWAFVDCHHRARIRVS